MSGVASTPLGVGSTSVILLPEKADSKRVGFFLLELFTTMFKTKKNTNNWNRHILQAYAQRPISFIPVLARLGESATAGLFLSQMLYWCGKGTDDEWVYKTVAQFEEETCLSRSEQQTAIRKWVGLKVLEKEVRNVPPTRHFRINVAELEKLLDIEFEIGVINESKSNGEQNTITESTSETIPRYASRLKSPTTPVHKI